MRARSLDLENELHNGGHISGVSTPVQLTPWLWMANLGQRRMSFVSLSSTLDELRNRGSICADFQARVHSEVAASRKCKSTFTMT